MILPAKFVTFIHLFWVVSLVAALPLVVVLPQSVQAVPNMSKARWVIAVLNSGGDNGKSLLPGALYTVDTLTDTLYGPFLQGQLGSIGGGLFDIDVTPDGETAYVSNFGDSRVSKVDVSDPTNLRLLDYLNLSLFAEDIAITRDGKFALVTDGGFSNRLASINIATHGGDSMKEELLTNGYANAVTVAPDGTVITVDYFNSKLLTLVIDRSGELTQVSSYDIPVFVRNGKNITDGPVNVAVAPDGHTVFVIPSRTDYVTIYLITGLGTLAFVGRVHGLPPLWDSINKQYLGGQQSVTFSPDGRRAYVISNGLRDPGTQEYRNNQISVLDIYGPGRVSLRKAGAATLLYNSSSQLFGVDCLAVCSNKLYVGNPTVSRGVTYLHVVNLKRFGVSTIPVGTLEGAVVTAVATIPPAVPTTPRVGGIVVSPNEGAWRAPLLVIAPALIISATALYLIRKVNRSKRLHS